MATGPGHMAPGRLGWQLELSTWHQGDLYGYIAGVATGSVLMAPERLGWQKRPDHMAPERLGWQQDLAIWHQGDLYGYNARPHGTRVAGMATGPGHMTPGKL